MYASCCIYEGVSYINYVFDTYQDAVDHAVNGMREDDQVDCPVVFEYFICEL